MDLNSTCIIFIIGVLLQIKVSSRLDFFRNFYPVQNPSSWHHVSLAQSQLSHSRGVSVSELTQRM